jgi:DNA (cytosine-5)-methyltransferase 1
MRNQKNVTEDFGTTHCSVAAPITFGSLFAGIGGFDLGFECAGMECKWQVEINEYCQRVLAKHWPNVHRWSDIRTWPQRDTECVDCIVGGFPCQDISYAGHGEGLAGERSGLWYEFARVIREMEPRYVVVENVSALLTRGIDSVLGTLASIGYDAEWDCVPASAVGAPHIRDRIWIVGYARSERRNTRRNDNRSDDGQESFAASEHTSLLANTDSARLPQRDEPRGVATSHRRTQARCELERVRATHGRQQWEVEPAVGRVADGVSKRVDRIRGLGNAVVPQLAEWIGHRIVAASKNVA